MNSHHKTKSSFPYIVYIQSDILVKHRLNSFLGNEGSFPVMNTFLFYL